MVATMTFDVERLASLAPKGFSLATDVADWLVRQRVPFAEAHEIAGAAVRFCEARRIELSDLTAADLPSISPHLTAEVLLVLTVAGSIDSRNGRGGTSTNQVRRQLGEVSSGIDDITAWIEADIDARSTLPAWMQHSEADQLRWTAERGD